MALAALLAPTGRILAQPQSGHGLPQRWVAGMAVSPYQTVHLRTGRVITTLPVVGWGGRGPGVSFSLYHNMTSPQGVLPLEASGGGSSGLMGDANGDGEVDLADVDPFVDIVLSESATAEEVAKADFSGNQQADLDDLDGFTSSLLLSGSPMWTHSYWMHLSYGPGLVYVHRDDGRVDTFKWYQAENRYHAPAGIYERLESELINGQGGYTLTTKDQWRYRFEGTGVADGQNTTRLAWIADATTAVDGEGLPKNRLTFEYFDGEEHSEEPYYRKLHKVIDAAGRELVLTYNAQGEIATITDPIGRVWWLLYENFSGYCGNDPMCPEGDGPFVGFQGPDMDPEAPAHPPILWGYTLDYEIAGITDKNGEAYAFEYFEG
ncbi:MAG: hypothetical protein DCC65_08750, partial [Planctomycetota bacterium]